MFYKRSPLKGHPVYFCTHSLVFSDLPNTDLGIVFKWTLSFEKHIMTALTA